ncbi:hypothetical protein Tco_1020633 [Tanacetum coccineum]
MALPPSDQRHQYLRSGQPDPTDTPRYEGLHYTNADIADFKTRLARIYRREVHQVQVFNFGGLLDLIVEGLSTRMLMEHRDAQGFGEAVLDLDTVRALLFQLGGVRRRMSWREFILALGLHSAEEMQTAGMDVGSVNVPYLLARYLRLSASGRKHGAMISRDLPVIDMVELVGLQICVKLDDTWAWVPTGPARQEGNAGGVAEEALVAPGCGDEDDEIPQAMPSPPRT